MKNLCLLLSFLTITTLFSQSTNFGQSIEQQLSHITATTSQEDWQTISQSFSELAAAHPDQWLTNYYATYAYMQLAGTFEDQTLPIVAEYLDKAQAMLDKANALVPNHSEIMVLQGFIYVARIWESPFMNGGLYGRKINKLFKEAIEIDPKNPRAYYLKGLLTYHTPRFVGGGKERAKPWLVTAKEKFEAFNFESAIFPYWGAIENQALLLECGGKAKENTTGQ